MKLNKHSGIRLRTESLKNTLPANKRPTATTETAIELETPIVTASGTQVR